MDGELKPTPEVTPVSPENRENREAERPREVLNTPEAAVPAQPVQVPAVPSVETPAVRPPPDDPGLAGVERILEDGLRDVYFAMPKAARERFRADGELLARRLRALVGQGNVRPNVVHRQVDRWLKGVPRANAFWLYQSGKIKTDRLMEKLN